MCDIASSIGKTASLDGNFGMGAKVASLPSNKLGLRYRSCRAGVVSEVLLGQRNGIYGRVRRLGPDGTPADVLDVTRDCAADPSYALSDDWTEVVLFGNRPEQDTTRDPYDGNPRVAADWIASSLALRFFQFESEATLDLSAAVIGGNAKQRLRTFGDMRDTFTRAETVRTPSGILIHYIFDAPETGVVPFSRNMLSGTGSFACTIYRGEMYDVRSDLRWSFDGPAFGVPFGSKFVSVLVELPADYPVRAEAYRQFLRFRGGDQHQVQLHEFAALVRNYMPEWLKRVVRSFGPDQANFTEEVSEELRALLAELGVPLSRPALTLPFDLPAPVAQARQPARDDTPSAPSLPPKPPEPKFQPPPEIVGLDTDALIAERGLVGRAARFYDHSYQLFINLRYPAIDRLAEQLEMVDGEAPSEQRRAIAREVAEYAITRRVARGLVFTLTKKNVGWAAEEVVRAQSPEALSLMADDWWLMLEPARRRMEQLLPAEAASAAPPQSQAA